MGRRQQAADRALRPKLTSPGHPKFQRKVEAAFWVEIAKGLLPSEAAAVVGVSRPVGQRWFHNGLIRIQGVSVARSHRSRAGIGRCSS